MSASKRILAIASGGGHFVQLLRLREAWAGHDVTYATVHAGSAVDVAPAPLLTFRDVSRADWWRMPLSLLDIVVILVRVRPQVIITTGAMPPLLAIALARPFGIRTLWIDSIANSEELSGSGHIANRFAGQVLTQWPALADSAAQPPQTGRGTIAYWGSVL